MEQTPTIHDLCKLPGDLPTDPVFEVVCPDGFRFLNSELHAMMAWSQEESEEVAKMPLEPCPDDCDCKEGNPEE